MTDKQLSLFKELLLKERERLEEALIEGIEELTKSECQGKDEADEAAHISLTSLALRLKERNKALLVKIDGALIRVKEKEFGECQNCDEDIELNRLKARPVTTFCLDCKERQEKVEGSFASN